MRKQILYVCITLLIVSVWFLYHEKTDDTYEGMTIIPEHQEDIPLYDGLHPTKTEYVIKGDQWSEIHSFYLNELRNKGWQLEHMDSALNDDNPNNDWSGFYSLWVKEDFEGELWVSANYNPYEENTEVIFDKHSN